MSIAEWGRSLSVARHQRSSFLWCDGNQRAARYKKRTLCQVALHRILPIPSNEKCRRLRATPHARGLACASGFALLSCRVGLDCIAVALRFLIAYAEASKH